MIALGEADPTAAEVWFFLASRSNPLVGVTLHDFSNNASTGEVKMELPSGSFFNVPGSQILEVGFGWYVVRLSSSQTLIAGVVSVYVVTSDAQPDYTTELIGTAPGGELAVLGTGVIPFYLPNAADPVYGTPVTLWSFTSGQVQLHLPRSTGFTAASLSDIVEFGHGGYGLKIGSSQSVNRGKAAIHVDIGTSSQPFSQWVTILGTNSGGSAIISTGTTLTPVPSPYSPTSKAYRDHTAGALSRLCEQFRAKAI